MTDGRAGIHGRLLDHLLDGVMVVERGGTITVLNPAAARILGVLPEEVAEKTFTELFIAREGFEEFSDLVLDAVTGEGEGGRQVVTLGTGDAARTLSVAISYIRPSGHDAGEAVALISVFSDITELRELRETELRMAKAVEAQHAELQTAYRRIEERNETLAAMLKKVQVLLHLQGRRLDRARALDGVAAHVEVGLHPVGLGEARDRDPVERIAVDAALVEAPQRRQRAFPRRAREGGPEGRDVRVHRRPRKPGRTGEADPGC